MITLVRRRYLGLTHVPDRMRTASMLFNFHESPFDQDKEKHDLHTNRGQRARPRDSSAAKKITPKGISNFDGYSSLATYMYSARQIAR